MPRGQYTRSEKHKEMLREIIKKNAEAAKINGTVGRYVRTDAHRAAFSERVRSLPPRLGADSPNWKGDDVGYAALHNWVERRLGKPSKCNQCGTEDAACFDWANKSGKYLRDLSDWERLCRSCHMKSDGRGFKKGNKPQILRASK